MNITLTGHRRSSVRQQCDLPTQSSLVLMRMPVVARYSEYLTNNQRYSATVNLQHIIMWQRHHLWTNSTLQRLERLKVCCGQVMSDWNAATAKHWTD